MYILYNNKLPVSSTHDYKLTTKKFNAIMLYQYEMTMTMK